MQTVTAPGANARTFLIHMFRRGLDDNRYVVERYKSTFDGEIVQAREAADPGSAPEVSAQTDAE